MELDGGSFVASLIVSAIGFVVFSYGRRLERVPQVAVGLLLLVFPYFVPDTLLMSLIAGVLLVGLWIALRLGL